MEAIGEDERGVDLWVIRADSVRVAQQCKRKNGDRGRWTVADLVNEGVIDAAAGQLRRHPAAIFSFVSAHPATELSELSTHARTCGGDAEGYFREELAVNNRAAALRRFCGAVGADAGAADERRQAFDLLTRLQPHLFEDSPDGVATVELVARLCVTGEPATVVELLAGFVRDQLGSPLSADHVRAYLAGRGHHPVALAGRQDVAGRLAELRQRFRQSLDTGLYSSAPVVREESATILDLIERADVDPTAARLIVLHGRAGGGKSCVLLQLLDRLDAAGRPALPLRLDRLALQASARRTGIEGCDLPDSPAVVLRSFYPDRPVVLVVDQLDAVRWTAAHAAIRWDTCRELIDEALRLPGITVVVACRTFDLHDDQQIAGWLRRHQAHRIEVGDLSPRAVAEAVKAAGGNYEELLPGQRTLLRTPLLLSLWATARSDAAAYSWRTQTDLMRAFWRAKFQAAEQAGVAAECRTLVSELAGEMDRRGELTVPARRLDGRPQAAGVLKSLQVLTDQGGRVGFAHQSYFEYQLADLLLAEASVGGRGVFDWVRGSGQTLMRREQLRLVLTMLRDDRPAEYAAAVRQLLTAPSGVRAHLKHLVLHLMGTLPDPSLPECELVAALARDPAWRGHLLPGVLYRQPVWFDVLDDRGLIAEWLGAGEESLVVTALQLCRVWSAERGDRVAALLATHVGRPAPGPHMLAHALPVDARTDTDALFRIRLQLVRANATGTAHFVWEEIADRDPIRWADLIEAHLDRREQHPTTDETRSHDRDVPYYLELIDFARLGRVVGAGADAIWPQLADRVARECERSAVAADNVRPDPFVPDQRWLDRFRLHPGHRIPLPAVVACAGATLAGRDPVSFHRRYGHLLDHRSETVQIMVGLALAWAESTAADLAIAWLCDRPARLLLDDDAGQEWGVAEQIIRRHAGSCSGSNYERLERTILSYYPNHERDSLRYHAADWRHGGRGPNHYGLTQHALLACLPAGRTTPTAKSAVGVLDRKFGRPAESFRLGASAEWEKMVGSVPADRVARVSDRGWLEIMAGISDPASRGRQRWRGDGTFTEDTVHGYALSLREQARREPARFARLAAAIPPAADPTYLATILSALTDGPPADPPPDDWRPVAAEQLTDLVEQIGFRPEPAIGRPLCRLLARPAVGRTAGGQALLARYATGHPDPAPDAWDDNQLEVGTLNATRAIALDVVADRLFEDRGRLNDFLPAIQQATADPSPVVRLAVVEACGAVLAVDRDGAVRLFLAAADGQDAMLAGRHSRWFLSYVLRSHFRDLEPFLLRMTQSVNPAVATTGASLLTIGYLGDQATEERMASCLTGTVPQRRGVALAAAHNCNDTRHTERCVALLRRLVADSDGTVQEAVSDFSRAEGVFRLGLVRDFAVQYVAGPAFAARPGRLIDALRRHPDSMLLLAPVLSAVCGRLSLLTDEVRRQDHYELSRLFGVMLRLYEQAEQASDLALRDRCLDWLDTLIDARVGHAVELLGRLDAGTLADAWAV